MILWKVGLNLQITGIWELNMITLSTATPADFDVIVGNLIALIAMVYGNVITITIVYYI